VLLGIKLPTPGHVRIPGSEASWASFSICVLGDSIWNEQGLKARWTGLTGSFKRAGRRRGSGGQWYTLAEAWAFNGPAKGGPPRPPNVSGSPPSFIAAVDHQWRHLGLPDSVPYLPLG